MIQSCMARSIRYTYPGALYHVINRGSRQDNIFTCGGDKQDFLFRLEKTARKYSADLFAYCLMDNHFHLLMKTHNPNISEVMRMLQGGYANWFRAKYGLVGPLFQSRYKSVLVEDEEYLVTLSAYIHLNPVRAGMVEHPQDYQWNSYRQYEKNEATELLDPSVVLHYAGGVGNYKAIVSDMTHAPPEKQAIYGKYGILGDVAFREKLKRQKYSEIVQTQQTTYATHELKHLRAQSPEILLHAVMEVCGVSQTQVLEKKRGNIARKLYLYLLKHYTAMTVREIAAHTGGNYHSTGEMIRRFEKEIADDKNVAEQVKRAEKFFN